MPTPSPARCPRLPLIAIMVLSAATLSAREQPATTEKSPSHAIGSNTAVKCRNNSGA